MVLCVCAVVTALVLLCQPLLQHKYRQMKNAPPYRGIHSALVLYSHGNNGYYPGLDSSGNLKFGDVETRLWTLLNDRYFEPEYLLLPGDGKTPWVPGEVFTSAHYSMALPMMAVPGGRRDEWRDTANTLAPIVSDRNMGSNPLDDAYSIYAGRGQKPLWWIAFNDNSVRSYDTHVFDTELAGKAFIDDNLFCADGPDDAWMIYSGTGE